MAKRYTTDEVVAMMSAPSPNVEMLEQPASPFLDPAQINAAERELSQPPPEYPRPDTIGTAITDAAGMDRPALGSSGNMALQNYEAQQAFPIDQTPAPQRPAGGSQTLYPSAQETQPSLPKPRYTTDEVMSLYMQQSKPRYSTKDVMLKMVQPLDDPTMPRLGRDEYFKAKEIKKSLQESGDLPSNWEETKMAVGGFLLTVPDAFATALYKTDKSQGWFEIGGAGFNPALALSETWRRSPATLAYASEMARQGYAGMAEGLRVMGGPKYRVAESGEFVMDDEESAGGQFGQMDPRNIVDRYKAKGLTLRPVNDEDKKDFEYQQWNKKMDRDLQVERARTAEMPPEFAYRMLVGSAAAVSDYNTGRNDFANITGNVGPMQSQAVVGSMLVDPLTYTTFGAAATRIGISAAAKGATARSLDIIGRAVNKAVKPAEVPLTQIDRFRKIVMPPAKVAGAYGLAAGAAYAADVMQLPPELKTAAYTAASLYTAYRGGLGVLRFVGKRFPEAAVILRESADPTNGLDLAARKVVATNPNVPSNVRARLERPSQFVSMESTPQRLSQNMALSPGTRKVMEKLSNWYVVQGVRGASDVATGAVKGAIVATPFAELTRLGGDERAADAMYGIGPALGAFGGAANRVFGARSRTIGRAESDIGRMLVDVQAGNTELRSKIGADGKAALQSWNFYNSEIGRMLTDVELAAGDVDALVKNRSFDELARIAAMQGFFRSKVDYIPLGAADFALNADQHGADGSAGFFLSVPDSERARIFVNVDARRADVEPHEFGEAFFSTGAFSPEQMAAMRSGVDARYGLDGVQKRANEYAESLIRASNATNFPNEKLVISAEQIQAKVNELAQAELQRGGNDPLDWVRREIMVEEWRMAGMDFASIRRNIPEGANPVKFIEDVLGANARALGLSGVRVDPETGIPITPEQLFRENPVAADDPVVMSNLKAYTKAYRAWLNDPAHEVPSGVKIAPDGRAESLANNPNFIFDANGQNPLATRDPQTGQVRWKSDKDRAKDAKVRGQQIRNVAGRDLVAPGSPQFGPKKTANGRIRISGRRLPAALELQNHWKPQLDKIRRLEALADGDESTQVLYVAMGNSADKVKTSRPQDIVAINREMVFDEWVVQGKNNDLYGQFLDLTTIRNRAMKAIASRNPVLDKANDGPGYSLQAIMDDVYQWMADKRAGKAGEATIGPNRKNIVNALINPGTSLNREKNPLASAFGRGSAIKTLLVDNIMAVSGTGRKGAAMDYNWANGNFMPDKPAPRPDVDTDLNMPSALPQAGMAMPEVATGGARGQAMPDVVGPIESAKELVQQRGRVSVATEEMFFGKVWPSLLAETKKQKKADPQNFKAQVKLAISDISGFLKDNPQFADYYNNDWRAARTELESHYGRALSEDEFMLYRLVAGLTSPGTKLPSNINDAVNLLDLYVTDGNFDRIKMGVKPATGNRVIAESPFQISGVTNPTKAFSVKVIDRLIKERGSVTAAVDYLREMVPVKELHAFNKRMGFAGSVSNIGNIRSLVKQATGQDELIPRMFIFNQKVGAYTLNAIGDSRFNTVDVWESRFIRSYFVDMFEKNTGLPVDQFEHDVFIRFTDLFKEEFEKTTGKSWDNSALQAVRWFYILDAAKKAGYTNAGTNQTISFYTRRSIGRLRSRSGSGGTAGNAAIGGRAKAGSRKKGEPIDQAALDQLD